MAKNLVPINQNCFLDSIEVQLLRDGNYNAILAISFYTNSRVDDGKGNDATETLIEPGYVKLASPILITDTSDGRRTGFYVEMRIESKKPSTGGGSRTRDIVNLLENKELAKNLASLL